MHSTRRFRIKTGEMAGLEGRLDSLFDDGYGLTVTLPANFHEEGLQGEVWGLFYSFDEVEEIK